MSDRWTWDRDGAGYAVCRNDPAIEHDYGEIVANALSATVSGKGDG